MAITIDPAAKRIILDSTTVTAQAIFVAWADWMLLSDNAKYLPAFAASGGDDLGGGLFIPAYYFLLNGWRVRPMESSHTLIITGNLFVEGGGVPVVQTLGSYNVSVQYTVPVQAQAVNTSGGANPWTEVIDGSHTAAEVMRVLLAVAAGKNTIVRLGGGYATVTFRDVADTKDVVVASMAGSERTSITLDVS